MISLRECVAALAVAMLMAQHAAAGNARAQRRYDRPGPYKIRTLEFPDLTDQKRDGRRVPLKVLFPSEGKGLPLVIISHGAGGNWDANLYQAQHLVSHGYIVVNVEHVFSNNARIKHYMTRDGGGMRFWQALHRLTTDPRAVLERPRDVSFAIDQATAWNREHAELAGRMDLQKIAVMGHSFGAYTVLVVCGARPILDHLDPPVAPGKGLASDLSDSRAAFGFAMSPQSPGGTFFAKQSYQTIDRPLVCLTGSRDVQKSSTGRLMPPHTRRQVFDLLPEGNKLFLWLRNADHMCFSDGPRARLLPSRAREDAQRISKALMLLACDRYLKSAKEAEKRMNKEYVNSLCGRVITAIEWHEK